MIVFISIVGFTTEGVEGKNGSRDGCSCDLHWQAPVYCFGDAETLNKTSTSLLHSQDGASSHGMLIGQILHSAYAK
ncbi:hypothetical protein JHK87_019984 [Glycine soja]|nr:hypothetical protein JHK87_019984 [Glycine soja]